MTDTQQDGAENTAGFDWHPEYVGKTYDEVHGELQSQIESDQRAHRLVMEGAEESEHEVLASVVTLERRWGRYDFGWAEMDADTLAARIVAFEREREARKELITWDAYRSEREGNPELTASGDPPARELSTSMKAISLIVVTLFIVVILLAVWAL